MVAIPYFRQQHKYIKVTCAEFTSNFYRRSTCLSLFVFISLVSFSQTKRLVIAHRGDHTEAPENTLKAYEDAIKNRVDYVEVDLRTSKDNKLVVMHDASVDRMTNGKGAVKELTFQQLQQLEVIDKERPSLGSHKILRFEEVLDLCKGKIKIYLDFKDADPKIVWEFIQKKKMEKSIVVYINHEDQYTKWRSVAPQMPLIVSLPDSIRSVSALATFIEKYNPDILDGGVENYTPEMVLHAVKMKKEIWLDFQRVNEGPLNWSRGIRLGIQGFQTDKPKELKIWLQGPTD